MGAPWGPSLGQKSFYLLGIGLAAIAGVAVSFPRRFLNSLGNRKVIAGLLAFAVIGGLIWAATMVTLESDSYIPRRTGPSRIAPYFLVIYALLPIAAISYILPRYRVNYKVGILFLLGATVTLAYFSVDDLRGSRGSQMDSIALQEMGEVREILSSSEDRLLLTNYYTEGSVRTILDADGILDGRMPYIDGEFRNDALVRLRNTRKFLSDFECDAVNHYEPSAVLIGLRRNAIGSLGGYTVNRREFDKVPGALLYRGSSIRLYDYETLCQPLDEPASASAEQADDTADGYIGPESISGALCLENAGARLKVASLDSAKLNGLDLKCAHLQSANLSFAQLRDSYLDDAILLNADLSDADIAGASLARADLRGANLMRANLNGSDLRDANFRQANLTGATLQHGDLRRADFSNATLDHADFWKADFSSANLKNASLEYTSLVEVQMKDAILAGARLRSANLAGSDLRRSDFEGADLSDASLDGTILTLANFTDATLEGASLKDTQLTDVTWKNTTCPDGTNSDLNGTTCEGHLGSRR